MEYIVEMLNIRKEFPGVVACDDITLQLKGRNSCSIRENGAGKSTLMNILLAYINLIGVKSWCGVKKLISLTPISLMIWNRHGSSAF